MLYCLDFGLLAAFRLLKSQDRASGLPRSSRQLAICKMARDDLKDAAQELHCSQMLRKCSSF